MSEIDDKHQAVQQAYARVARAKSGASCCSPKAAASCCGPAATHPAPEADLGLSCGDPVEYAALQAGEVVLDLGSGAGRDAFLAAMAVGNEGRVIGVDMTPEMIALARDNAMRLLLRKGIGNVEFRQGLIEELPVDDASVDVILSNCVINLSPDKPRVFREAYRVLRPGGRLTVSDIVLNRPLPQELLGDMQLYAACIAGALMREDYLKAIADAGFGQIEVRKDVTYDAAYAGDDPTTSPVAEQLEGYAASITVVATK